MSDEAAVIDAVKDMVEAVNRGIFARAVSAFSENACAVEDISPFRWQGPSAAIDWLQAMGANAAKLNVSAILMKLEMAERVEVEANHAYVLVPGSLRMRGLESELRADGLLTFTLSRKEAGWLIDTLTWSGPHPAAE
jgi:ketosteroid isomerase-like protein